MKRRDVLKSFGSGMVAATSLAVGGKALAAKPEFKWKMVTTWPKNFPVLGTNANYLAKTIEEMSGGRIRIKVYGANELVPAFEAFDAVSRGTVEMGHGAPYYWKGKSETAQFFSAIPFGMTAQEVNGWLYYGGGLALWEELYDRFNLVPMATGNTGVQMAGWFRKDINSVDDLQGLKMRIPGLGGEVLSRAGGTPVSMPGGEIFTSLQSGAIDATEWIGPYNDLAFGLYKAAKNYYYPGWHEPGSTLETFVNKQTFESLPKDLQAIVKHACKDASMDMISEFSAKNNAALDTLVNKHQVSVKALPDDVLKKLHLLSNEVVQDIVDRDAFSQKVYASYSSFQQQAIKWSDVSEYAYMRARGLGA
ncbi:TRAP transporter substrate-binding protein [Cycloclasticus sp.]|jgi:TRAP-type mannitol/chloroaromatic compound transport system substrate-binding protein|uniref:TRAP transporter substrate-binding protein n=1 Tax=Cycloclasticus TaxID=34067 RepID=UPI000C119B18|nr:TRAP transporter substrate-binding protein [Cycloclasticus sp.]PHR50368.1 MAG: ABC transporter substrate-binding protein [Cycloclasticus sp.]